MKKKDSQVIFDRNVIEFVTVAAEFCKFVEQAEGSKRTAFVDTTLKLLPLLYLKASMLPPCETIGDEAPETFVTEETYEIVRMNLADILADRDDYLDVFVSDMKYSDQPITRYISEDLADIYQDIRDFIFVFQLGLNETPGELPPVLGTEAGEHAPSPARGEVQRTGQRRGGRGRTGCGELMLCMPKKRLQEKEL